MKRRVIKINPNIAQSNVKSYKPVQSRHKVHLPKTTTVFSIPTDLAQLFWESTLMVSATAA